LLDFAFTNQFKKDLKLMEKRRRNMDKIPLLTPELTPIIFDESSSNLLTFWK